MIGLVAKLAKAAKLAHTAEAAIDLAANRIAPSAKLDPTSAGAHPPVDAAPADYRALLEAGAPDARGLLSAAEAAQIIGKPIRKTSLAGSDGTLQCDYRCNDAAGTTLGLHIATTQPWHSFDSEIAKKEIFHDVGDAAFRGGRQLYVRSGETVFWIHTAGEVMVGMALEAARLVAGRLGAAPARQD